MTGIFILLFLIIAGIYFLRSAFADMLPFMKDEFNILFKNARLSEQQKSYLQKYHPYYQKLSSTFKSDFERRTALFICGRKFTPKGNFVEVSELQKVLIGAAMVQLTFGLKPLYFPRFKHIMLYPGEYINPFTKKAHQGEATNRGFMVLSWKHFLEGYAFPTDALNLGIHEMAHALRIEDRTSHDGEHQFIDPQHWRDWDKNAMPIFKAIIEGKQVFLRKYASENSEEFFAVCAEYFFEKPEEYKAQLPVLYNSMVKILNQDPARGVFRCFG